MRKILILLYFLLLASHFSLLQAQPIRDEILGNLQCSAGMMMAYPLPVQHKLTPAPEGKEPFYISHYGRHGSCYLTKAVTCEFPYKTLSHADSLGKLTPLGREVLNRLNRIYRGARDRWGELTEKGATEQREIMNRMVERFPEVFADLADIDARSTGHNACILSMEYAMMQLSMMRPKLKIHHNATRRDMSYLGQQAIKMDSVARADFDDFSRRYKNSNRLERLLFSEASYLSPLISHVFNDCMFKIAGNLQNTTMSNWLTLYDLFADEEIYDYWERENARIYCTYGPYLFTSHISDFTSQLSLLRKIIEQADNSIQQKRPSASLRWGQETSLLPLVCLLDINKYGEAIDNLGSLGRRNWCDYKISPMSGNIQLVFYRKDLEDKDVLVKVLLNENEATLPLETDIAPYYHWQEVRAYFLNKLDAYGKR